MITLSKITLKNACQHETLSLTPGSGLVAILGANGSGKSNVLRLIVYALTGAVDGTWGSQSDLQMDSAAVPGYVELHLQDADHTYRIRRYFLDAVKYPDEFQQDSDDPIYRRAKVNTKLTELFGIPLNLLSSLIWAKQELFDWLLCAPAALVKSFFSEVFDASILGDARNKVNAAVKSIYVAPDMTARLEATRSDIAQHRAAFDSDTAKCADVEVKLRAAEAVRDTLEARAASGMPYSLWHLELSRASSTLANLKRKLEEPETDTSAYVAELERIRALRMPLIEHRISVIHDYIELRSLELSEAKTAYATLSSELTGIKSDIASAGTGKCPFCHTDLGSPERVQALVAERYQVADLQTYIDTLTQSVANYTAVQSRLTQRCKRAKVLLSKLRNAYESLKATASELESCIHSAEVGKLRKEQALVSYAEAEANVQRLEASPHMSEEATAELDATRAYVGQLTSAYTEATAEASRHQALLTAAENLLVDLEKQQQIHDRSVLLRTVLQALADCFSAKRAQAAYIAKRMEALNELLMQRMHLTDLPFELFFDTEDCMFKYRTADGYVHPTGHLSGAQKKICAMVLQVCLYEHVNPNLDLLLLDEVDAALDPSNRIMLAGVLAALRRDSSGCIIVATRERETIEQCTTVVDITEKGEV